MTTVIKRKYIRKGVKAEKEPKKELEELKQKAEEPEELEKIFEKLIIKGTRDIPSFYIFTEDVRIDTLKYIKVLQVLMENKGINSQIQLCSKDHVENVQLSNCYRTDSYTDWTIFSLNYDVHKLLIKERPKISPEKLYDLIRNIETYEDNFIKFI